MATTEPKVRRTLHFRFTMPSGDPAQLLSFVNASKPLYEMFGDTEVRLMQNVDDPALARALEELKFFSRELRILGVYPASNFRATFKEEKD